MSLFSIEAHSSKDLIKLCLGYFIFYVITGLTVKYFQGSAALGYPGMSDYAFLVYSTLGAQLLCVAVVVWNKWYKLSSSSKLITVAKWKIPQELLYIIPSGICTAVVIPATTLMYSLPISVMVAMIIMRGAVIIISRLVDEIQLRQGLLKKKLRWEENVAVIFALMAIGVHLVWEGNSKGNGFDFIHYPAAMIILGSYIMAYGLRIYIMNYFKNTASTSIVRDNRSFFGIEQLAAFITLLTVTLGLLFWTAHNPNASENMLEIQGAFLSPQAIGIGAAFAGMSFGMVAFFSVFIFMFKGRTATFAGLVNRLTSLIAGTCATLLSYFFLDGKFPKNADWVSLIFILTAVWFLTKAEKNRNVKLEENENENEKEEEAIESSKLPTTCA
jgi:hypothetical protein